MPIELGIWRIDTDPQPVRPTPMDDESRLEAFLEQDPGLVGADLMIIGRQVPTAYGKYIDLLAVNAEGELVVIELKRDRTPRDIVAQTLDYGSWIKDLSYEEVKEIYEDYAAKRMPAPQFEEAFAERFNSSPESLNEGHRLVIVASELDPGTERIITYLAQDYGVPINAVFFQHFHDGVGEYLTRTWLQDPRQVQATPPGGGSSKKEPWNGRDYYVSFGDGPHRSWEDAQKYGFISGGQGLWYSKTLGLLSPGARVFVHIPGEGYVGVGTVTEEAKPVNEFTVEENGRSVPILQVPDLKAPRMGENAGDEDKSEYLVRVDWIEARSKTDAYWTAGLFANQNTVCRLRNKFTLEKLRAHFGVEE